jgi:tetratricopeptide (TPR) repeat protein
MSFLHTIVITSILFLSLSSLVWSNEAPVQTREGKSIPQAPAVNEQNKNHEANLLESQAISLIDNHHMDKGMGLMKQAAELDPTPLRDMNYGSVLLGQGAAAFKKGNKEEATKTLRQAENYLTLAIAGFDPTTQAAFISQCYFLMGEIYANAFFNKDKAKDFYYKSLEYNENESSRKAIQALQQ